MRPSLSPKKCILPFSVTVYPSQTRFSHPAISLACAFNSSGKAGSCFPSMINWRYLSSHCDNGAKVLRNVSAVTVVPNGCPANCGFVINPPIIPARGQRHSPAHPHHSLYYMAQMRRAVCRLRLILPVAAERNVARPARQYRTPPAASPYRYDERQQNQRPAGWNPGSGMNESPDVSPAHLPPALLSYGSSFRLWLIS